MKKTILVVLMAVMVATPCLAQEIETDGLFSIEGTLWGYCVIRFGIVNYGGWLPFIVPNCENMGFYQGTVYSCNQDGSCGKLTHYSYIDSPLVSIVYDEQWNISRSNIYVVYGILQPGGFGVYTQFAWGSGPYGKVC